MDCLNPKAEKPWQLSTPHPDATAVLPVPYLDAEPDVIDIDMGRQLFVDDVLIESTDTIRTFHQAEIVGEGPVLQPQTPVEMNDGQCPVAAPFNDGVWYDPEHDRFRIWYHAGWFDGTACALSRDGINWERPALGVRPGTNAVLPRRDGVHRDGCCVWRDCSSPDPSRRWVMFQFSRDRRRKREFGEMYTSRDGVHWVCQGETSPCGDNTSFFYNPFRGKWVFSIRRGVAIRGKTRRARFYAEGADLLRAARWLPEDEVFWSRCDELDLPDPQVGIMPELYDLNATPYESIMLGLFGVFYGPQNHVCAERGVPKRVDLQLGFSRDGFHFSRPCRNPFIACSRQPGSWNYGYIHAAGGGCLLVRDRLYFYFGAFSGQSPTLSGSATGSHPQANAMYAGGSTGLATLRRDGFASLDAGSRPATVTTRPLRFNGRDLFVNADIRHTGVLRVAVLDCDGHVIPGLDSTCCDPIRQDGTRIAVRWEGGSDLAALANRPVRLQFTLSDGRLYAFWVSRDSAGHSGGAMAAGGPGINGQWDR